MKKAAGYSILILCCLNTVTFWLMAKDSLDSLRITPLIAISQVLALLGFVLMSQALLFSTRFKILEDIYGGLDVDYMLHHIIGGVAFLFLINHPLFLAVHYLPHFKLSILYLLPGYELANDFGLFAIYTMIASFVFISFIKIAYHKWLWTHRLLVVSFVLGGIHMLLIQSDVSNSILLKMWLTLFYIIGCISSFYILFIYKYLGPRFEYAVNFIEIKGSVINMFLVPLKRHMGFKAGQFIYMRFLSQVVGTEMHPFTISSAPWEDTMRISAKVLGDFTKQMMQLRIGDHVILFGPYGRFGDFFATSRRNLLFIAGGIGVTPFLSMLRYESLHPRGRRIVMVYSYKNQQDAIFNDEIALLVKYIPNVLFVPWSSQAQGHFSVQHARQLTGNLETYTVLMCGPERMMKHLENGFMQAGINEEDIIFENFDYL